MKKVVNTFRKWQLEMATLIAVVKRKPKTHVHTHTHLTTNKQHYLQSL